MVSLMAFNTVTAGDEMPVDHSIGECPSKPNCVSSASSGDSHYVAPFAIAGDAAEQWRSIVDAVSLLPRTRIVMKTERYIHAESRSRIFGFVDDLELALEASTGLVGVRSASRIGYSDLGVNRKRVERLRTILLESGTIEDM